MKVRVLPPGPGRDLLRVLTRNRESEGKSIKELRRDAIELPLYRNRLTEPYSAKNILNTFFIVDPKAL